MIRCPECNRNDDNHEYCSLCCTDLTEARREASKYQKINFYYRSLSIYFFSINRLCQKL